MEGKRESGRARTAAFPTPAAASFALLMRSPWTSVPTTVPATVPPTVTVTVWKYLDAVARCAVWCQPARTRHPMLADVCMYV